MHIVYNNLGKTGPVLYLLQSYALMQHAMFSNAVSSKHENYIYADSVFTVSPFSPLPFNFFYRCKCTFQTQEKPDKTTHCKWLHLVG